MNNYLVRFRNAQKVNKELNGSPISRGVQEHGTKILYSLHLIGFASLSDYDIKDAETSG